MNQVRTLRLLFLFAALLIAVQQNLKAATTREWVGASDTKWSIAANWNPAGQPVNGDSVILTGAGAFRPEVQDITGLTLESIRFDSTATTTLNITGGAITFSGANGITVDAGNHRIAFDITLQVTQNWSIAQGATLEVAGRVKDQSPQLVAHWTFDEASGANVIDNSGANNPGTIKGATLTRIPGVVGSGALDFGNTTPRDGYVDIPSFTWPNSGDAVTLSFWINVPTGGNNGVSNLFGVGDRDDAGDDPDLSRFATHAPWNDNFVYWDYGHYNGPNDEGRVSTVLPRRDDWIHVAFVSSGTSNNFMGIYFDGVLASSQNRSSAPIATLTGMTLGRSPDFAWYQSGKLDDFRIYKGLLSAPQVAQLAAKTEPAFSSGQGLTKSGAGTLIFSSPNSYTGTTNIGAGTLLAINTSGSATGTGSVNVATSGVLSGTGILGGAVTVDGTVLPGVANAGTLTLANSVSFQANSTLQSRLSAAIGGSATKLIANGVTINSTANLNITVDSANRTNAPYSILENQSNSAIAGNFNLKPNGVAFSTNGVSFIPNYAGGSGNDLTLQDDTPAFPTNPLTQTIDVGAAPAPLTAVDSAGDTLSYSIVSGNLPPNLTLSTSGTFQNVAASTAIGDYSTRIRVTDLAGGYDEADLVITVKNVVFSVLDLSVAENGGVAHVVITRDGGIGQTTTLQVRTEVANSPIAATPGADYSTTTQTVQFGPQQTSIEFDVPLLDDALSEGAEIFRVLISNPSVGNIGRGEAIVTITDDEPVPIVSLVDATLNVAEAVGTLTVRARLESGSSGTVSVDFLTINGTATAPADFTATQGSLSWAAGDSGERVITIPILNDILAENSESFRVELANPLRSALGNSVSVVTIIDDEPLPTFSVADMIVDEAVGSAQITVTLRTASDHILTIDYATANGTATAGLDYQGVTGTLQWAAGETGSKTFPIPIIDDLLADSGEIVRMLFTNATIPAEIETPLATLRILDTDIGPRAEPDPRLTPQNTPISIDALINDTGLVHTPIRVTLAQSPANGFAVVNADNSITYSPAINFTGTDSFSYAITDALGQTSTAIVTVTIKPPPTFLSLPSITPNPCIVGTTLLAQTSVDFGTVRWNWGDGSEPGTSVQSAHVYSAPGIYTLTVTCTSTDNISTTYVLSVFVSLSLNGTNGDGSGGGATPPGVGGILVGGAGAGKEQGASGKIRCNYVRRAKTSIAGSLGMIALPATLKQSDLATLSGKLIFGTSPSGPNFAFMLGNTGRSKATGLPSVELNVKKKRFRFRAQRSDLTDLAESLGGPQQFQVTKGEQVLIHVPITLQIGDILFLAMTFEMKYQQIGTAGKGQLTP